MLRPSWKLKGQSQGVAVYVETGTSREVTWSGASEMLTSPHPGRDHTGGLARGGEKWSCTQGRTSCHRLDCR